MPARLTLTGPQRSALAGDINVHVRVKARRADLTWVDLSSYFGTDWFVKGQLRASIDDPVWTATLTLLREDGAGISLAPQMSASAANRDGGGAYSPLVATGNRIQVLTATTLPNVAPVAGDWKRMFDGYIDSTDPGGDEGMMVVVARDLGGVLQDTFIEVKRTYATTPTAVETVFGTIITDNAVAGTPAVSTPTSPGWIIKQYEQSQVPVMQALRDLALQIGWDLRYFYLADGDVDPTLLFYQPPRSAATADWTFGPGEYSEIPSAKLDSADIRNAVEISYRDANGFRQSITSVNAASITQFRRRFMLVTEADASNIDTSAEATAMGDALVADLGEPALSHQMVTAYFWPVNLNDMVQFDANGVHYDQAQLLATFGITHEFEAGHGQTTLDCRGQPAGAFHEWLGLAGKPSNGGELLVIKTEVTAQDTGTITVKLTATAPGSTRQPAIELLWTGINPPVTLLSGGAVLQFEPNGSEWVFAKPTPGQGASLCGFMATLSGFADTMFTVPIPEATAFVGPNIDQPSVVPNDDPDDSVDVFWTPHSAPAGAKYILYWRADSGDSWTAIGYATIGTANTWNIPHSTLGMVISTDPLSGGASRLFQAYVEMYDSGGTYLCQSPVGNGRYYFLGFG